VRNRLSDKARPGYSLSGPPVLSKTRLLYVTPAVGRSGVGDYAADFAAEIRPHFADLIEYQVETAPRETVGELVRDVHRIRALAAEHSAKGPTIAHFEQSGASLAAFWAAMVIRNIPVTATIHDAPQPVWWPFATRGVTNHRLTHHGVHYPIRFVSNALQRRMCKGRNIIALTSIGARETQVRQPGAHVRATRIFIPTRQPSPALPDRPLAVGLFGFAYKAKGFDRIKTLRAHLDSDIEIVVAGRGTENIPAIPGVTVLGEVIGPDEDQFFARIRFLVVPYAKTNLYGPVYAASSAVARAHAYGTPVICNFQGALSEVLAEGGALGIDGDVTEFAALANTAIRDEESLLRLSSEVEKLRAERTVAHCATPFLDTWHQIATELVR
jgi:polysaccharide biosynthesis protein PslF